MKKPATYVISLMFYDVDSREHVLSTMGYESNNLHHIVFSAMQEASGSRRISRSSILIHYVKTSENGKIIDKPQSKKYEFNDIKNYLNACLEIANDV